MEEVSDSLAKLITKTKQLSVNDESSWSQRQAKMQNRSVFQRGYENFPHFLRSGEEDQTSLEAEYCEATESHLQMLRTNPVKNLVKETVSEIF